jgi:phosphoribosylaminoimidazole-succinocarboxamide synthase
MPGLPLLRLEITGLTVHRGKVRDVFDLGDRLLLVSTDRISAFDWVLPTAIPDKGRVLNLLSKHWFGVLDVPHHMISTDPADFGLPPDTPLEPLTGRAMLVKKAEVVPFECVVRGYLAGSGWKEYQKTGQVCGISLPPGLRESDQLPKPIFTPATKAQTGHDENVPFSVMEEALGRPLAERLRDQSLALYHAAARRAGLAGIIIADTKFEWGRSADQLILIDEVFTPDSSRFWPANLYSPGKSQPSFDKQFVRDYLESTGWDKNSPPPELTAAVVAQTRQKYVEAFERITGTKFPWT